MGSLNSTDVIGQLYQQGYRLSRERVARISDLLWPNGEHRPSQASHRRWTADQVEIMRITLVLHDDLGVSLDHIAAKVAESGTAEGLLAMARTMESRLRQVEEDLNGLTERKSA